MGSDTSVDAAHPTTEMVAEAQRRIAGWAGDTPLVRSDVLSDLTGVDVRLKLDHLQPSGSFKMRGAANRLLDPRSGDSPPGVVTYSTGNHGRAVATMAGSVGIPAAVCVSHLVPDAKLEALRRAGAEIEVTGTSQDEAAAAAVELASRRGWMLVDPIQDPEVIAGHGTAAAEIVEQWPDVDTIVVPVSGGALAAGVGVAAGDRVRLVGVSLRRGAAMHASLAAGHPVDVEEIPSIADSLQGGIGLDNRHTFALCRRHLADLVLVDDDAIELAMALTLVAEGLVVEGAAAASIAAVLAGSVRLGSSTCLLLTGAAVDPFVVIALAERHHRQISDLLAGAPS